MARKRKARRSSPKHGMFRRILLAVDNSRSAKHAAQAAIQMARKNNAELIVTSVVPTPKYLYAADPVTAVPTPGLLSPMLPTPIYASEREAAAKLVQKTFQRSKQRKLKVKKKVLDAESSVADAITDYAKKQKADLIVVGTSSVRGLKRFVLGSISSVVNNANTSVLVVR